MDYTNPSKVKVFSINETYPQDVGLHLNMKYNKWFMEKDEEGYVIDVEEVTMTSSADGSAAHMAVRYKEHKFEQ